MVRKKEIRGIRKEQTMRRKQLEIGCKPISVVWEGMDSASSSFAEFGVLVD
jgi:hypothetical protein